LIEFDVETTGFQPYSGHYPFSFQFYDGTKSDFFWWDPATQEGREQIQAWFDRAADEGLRAWNSKFDLSFAETQGFKLPPEDQWHDGMLEANAIDERKGVALKAVSSRLFGEQAADLQKQVKAWINHENARRRKVLKEADKLQIQADAGDDLSDEEWATIEEADELRYDDDLGEPGDWRRANYSDVPAEIMEPYGLEDVFLTKRVCDHFETVFENQPDLRRVVEFERAVMPALYAIEKRGLPADEIAYRKLEVEVSDNLATLEDKVIALAFQGDPKVYADELGREIEVSEDGRTKRGEREAFEFNPRSSPQVLAALKARGADMQYMSVKDGAISADADNLRAVDDELAAAILEYRAEAKVLGTYVRPMIGRTYVSAMNSHKEPFIAHDGRIHTTYRQVGARTGRMSSADPNMQNQPRDDLRLRYNIVADEGFSLVTCDLSNIEMVLFAAYCGEGRLLDAVRSGADLHVLTANMLGFRDRKRPGGGYESARQQGKVYNFTTIYGGGLRSIRRYFRCDMNTARLYQKRYREAYPEFVNFQNLIDYRLQDQGYIQDKLISGRRFRCENPQRDGYKMVNYIVQGTAAALLKYAVTKLHADGVPMVALVHDEIVAHVPTNEAEECGNLIQARMTEFEGLKGVVPLSADFDVVKRWSDAKPLKEEGTGRPYYFDPKWAGVERRYLDEGVAT
jgi:DNA polymerase I-like protein with 3'-5' exonuclease and polymerase domains